uniref:BsmBI restriction endonuclease n=1 Tax=Geobacillus stearothermophilus TaxID=1422 RepID=Q69B20_GEOSE|nr:BsmBI restriction endonuclease [Geobacillus stearothermophilus]
MAKYGRGKFLPHQNYIDYMHFIVNHKNYSGMPNAIGEDGRINWQVSSGKTTSFYEYYQARFEWWEKKADELNLPGTGNSNKRFSLAARLIHPTGQRPCRLCGKYQYVGYMYVSHNLYKRWSKITGREDLFFKKQNIIEAANIFKSIMGEQALINELTTIFPERKDYFNRLPNIEDFFVSSSHIKNNGNYISPGFMANPPDRLDGFHDYGICCRKEKDPGRHDDNMRLYNHDRRAFMWWSEGDWALADALYNKAGAGKCADPDCQKEVEKISPDHVGPISCGFKQIPFFKPLCASCNSAKNRRFSYQDVKELLKYENYTGDSVASWQVRALWDNCKHLVKNDDDSKLLSNLMRSLQDYYLRSLYKLFSNGFAHLLSYFLTPEYAHYKITFEGLNTSTLEYERYYKTFKKTKSTSSLAARIVRIAFEELEIYNSKDINERKLIKFDTSSWEKDFENIISYATKNLSLDEEASKWNKVLTDKNLSSTEKDKKISSLLEDKNYEVYKKQFYILKDLLVEHFNKIGEQIAKDYMK